VAEGSPHTGGLAPLLESRRALPLSLPLSLPPPDSPASVSTGSIFFRFCLLLFASGEIHSLPFPPEISVSRLRFCSTGAFSLTGHVCPIALTTPSNKLHGAPVVARVGKDSPKWIAPHWQRNCTPTSGISPGRIRGDTTDSSRTNIHSPTGTHKPQRRHFVSLCTSNASSTDSWKKFVRSVFSSKPSALNFCPALTEGRFENANVGKEGEGEEVRRANEARRT